MAAETRGPVGQVMVIGAGIAGVQAALDLANSGFYVHLVEKKSAIGGVMAQLDKTFPTNDCSMCIISPKLVECGRHLNIEIHTLSEVKAMSGTPGNFKVSVEKEPRYIDPSKCTGCGSCAEVCPVRVPDEFNLGLAEGKAVYRLYPQAIPATFAIKKADRAPCVRACPANLSAQGYVQLIKEHKYPEALALIMDRLPLPGTIGRVCPHPCETDCRRQEVDEPIAICNLKRFRGRRGGLERPAGARSSQEKPVRGHHRRRSFGSKLRLPSGPPGLQGGDLRGRPGSRRLAALRHPGIPAAPEGLAAGSGLHQALRSRDSHQLPHRRRPHHQRPPHPGRFQRRLPRGGGPGFRPPAGAGVRRPGSALGRGIPEGFGLRPEVRLRQEKGVGHRRRQRGHGCGPHRPAPGG